MVEKELQENISLEDVSPNEDGGLMVVMYKRIESIALKVENA